MFRMSSYLSTDHAPPLLLCPASHPLTLLCPTPLLLSVAQEPGSVSKQLGFKQTHRIALVISDLNNSCVSVCVCVSVSVSVCVSVSVSVSVFRAADCLERNLKRSEYVWRRCVGLA